MDQAKAIARIIDLSYTLEEKMPVWPTHARFGSTVYESHEYGAVALHSRITFSEHTGTHIDAPLHFIPGGQPIDKVSVETVIGRGVKIEAQFVESCKVLTLDNILDFEKQNGEIKQGDIVMLHFGWDAKYSLEPDCSEFLRDWPGLSGEGAEYLLKKKVAAVGCDALALDAFNANPLVCHQLLLGSGIPIIENIANLDQVPTFSYVIGLPLKIKDGSGSPMRLIAYIE